MKIKGIVFILFAACVGHIGAMEPDKGIEQKKQGMQQGTTVPSLKQLAAIATVKNIIQKIHSAKSPQNAFIAAIALVKDLIQKIYSPAQSPQQIINAFKDAFREETSNWSQLPLELREPLLAELGRQYYMLYGIQLDTGVPWGLSIQEYLDSPVLKNKIPKITTTGGRTGLKLSNMKINNLQGLQKIPNIKTVQTLSLNNNQLTTVPTKAFAGLPNLKWLGLSDNKLTTVSTKAFAGLTNLRWLHLENNQLTTIQPNVFAGLHNLYILNLSYNQLTIIPTNAFAGLTKLNDLYLEYNPLTTIQQNAFAGLTNLIKLHLGRNQLTTIQTNAFAGLTNLQWLTLENNQLTIQTKDAIKKALPRVQIDF